VAQLIKEVMSEGLETCPPSASVQEVAEKMRDADTGAILVSEGGELQGLITDRDIVLRAVADGQDPTSATAKQVCSSDVHTLSPDAPAEDAVDLIRRHNVRRIPVVDGDKPVGIVTIGDLAVARDEKSALADISAAAPNN
jgi:CBS domain-containing protein